MKKCGARTGKRDEAKIRVQQEFIKSSDTRVQTFLWNPLESSKKGNLGMKRNLQIDESEKDF